MSKEDKEDYVIPGPMVGERSQVFHRYRTGEAPYTQVMRHVREGESIDESAVCLRRRGDSNKYDVEPLLGGGDGPAQVATEEYRDGWDRIFGGKQTIGEA